MLAAFLVATPCLLLSIAGLAVETARILAAIRAERRICRRKKDVGIHKAWRSPMTRIPSRRAIVAGLAVAPVAGLPAIAGTVGVDPALEALAEYDRLHAIELAARKASRALAWRAGVDVSALPGDLEARRCFAGG